MGLVGGVPNSNVVFGGVDVDGLWCPVFVTVLILAVAIIQSITNVGIDGVFTSSIVLLSHHSESKETQCYAASLRRMRSSTVCVQWFHTR